MTCCQIGLIRFKLFQSFIFDTCEFQSEVESNIFGCIGIQDLLYFKYNRYRSRIFYKYFIRCISGRPFLCRCFHNEDTISKIFNHCIRIVCLSGCAFYIISGSAADFLDNVFFVPCKSGDVNLTCSICHKLCYRAFRINFV